jgi:hypothetical protein
MGTQAKTLALWGLSIVHNNIKRVGFEVFTAMNMKNAVFWDKRSTFRTSKEIHYFSAIEPSRIM